MQCYGPSKMWSWMLLQPVAAELKHCKLVKIASLFS